MKRKNAFGAASGLCAAGERGGLYRNLNRRVETDQLATRSQTGEVRLSGCIGKPIVLDFRAS